MAAYATVDDLNLLWRKMTAEEQTRASALLDLVSDSLRMEANRLGKDLDLLIASKPAMASVAKSVTVDVTARVLRSSTEQEPLSQFSQTAGPFTVSGTYLVPGGGIFIKRSELARLGLLRQRIGVLDPYGIDLRADD